MPDIPAKPKFKLAKLSKAEIAALPRITGFGADHPAAQALRPLLTDMDIKIIPKAPGPPPDVKRFTFSASNTYIKNKGALFIRNADLVFPGGGGGTIVFSQNTKASPVAFYVLLQRMGSYIVDINLGGNFGTVTIRIQSGGPDTFMTLQPFGQTVRVFMTASAGQDMFAVDTNNVLSSWSLESITFSPIEIAG